MSSTIVHVQGDDWEGVYLNNRLVAEGHSVAPHEWLNVIERLGARTDAVKADGEWLRNRGRLPLDLGNVKGA